MIWSLFGLAILASPAACLAASLEDYAWPIGRLDPPILCDRPQSTDTAKEANCLGRFRDAVTRSGDDLTFKLDNGKTKVVRSNSKACQEIPIGDCVIYELIGYVATSRQFVLQMSLYESVFVRLVSRRTGVITELEGYPRLSPSGRQFVTVAASDAWEIKNPIAIYSNTDPPQLKWRFPQPREYEEYSFDGWDGEDRVRLHTITNPLIETDVKRAADGWTLRRPNGSLSSGISLASPAPDTSDRAPKPAPAHEK